MEKQSKSVLISLKKPSNYGKIIELHQHQLTSFEKCIIQFLGLPTFISSFLLFGANFDLGVSTNQPRPKGFKDDVVVNALI